MQITSSIVSGLLKTFDENPETARKCLFKKGLSQLNFGARSKKANNQFFQGQFLRYVEARGIGFWSRLLEILKKSVTVHINGLRVEYGYSMQKAFCSAKKLRRRVTWPSVCLLFSPDAFVKNRFEELPAHVLHHT